MTPAEVHDQGPASAPPPSVVQVVRVSDALAEPLAQFFRRVWTDGSTADEVRRGLAVTSARNPITPGEEPPAVAFLRDGEILGYLGTIPVKFWNGTTETSAHWLKGFMVLPEHRNGPVGFAVLREILKHLGVSGIMAVALPALRLFTAVGFKDLGALPNYVSPLRPSRIASKMNIAAIGLDLPGWLHRSAALAQRAGVAAIGGGILGVALSSWRLVRGSTPRLRINASGSLPDRTALDDLWQRARATFAAGAVRDGNFLQWRYQVSPGSTYEGVSVTETGNDSRVVAIAVVRRPKAASDPRLQGIKVATLSDILFPADRPEAGVAAIAGAERVARRMGADALVASASHPAIAAALQRRGSVRLSGNLHLMLRDPAQSIGLPSDVGSWWVMRGDASSDDVF